VHTNPNTGEEEDTDVGFPGPEHHIAERAAPMKVAMGVLAVLALVAGFIQVPFAHHLLEDFLEPTFARSEVEVEPSDALSIFSLVLGGALSIAGIGIAYAIWGKPSTIAQTARSRFAFLHRLFSRKWYFDELIDWTIVKPWGWFGRFGQSVFERAVVNGTLVGGTSGLVRAGSAAVRAVQSGYLRYYAALLIAGVAVIGFYFLLQA
jgi:NADH-quinone oxidoreductase subunit L